MLKVSQLMRIGVYQPKRATDANPSKLEKKELTLLGEVRQVVFSPKGDKAVGVLVRRPDVAGVIKRDDIFLALDSFVACDYGLVATKGTESFDDAARERLGLDWDHCLLWHGMDAKTTDDKVLGWVADVEFNTRTGNVESFYVGDGSVAESLVGDVVIPGNMLRGYSNGYLMVDPKAASLSLDGGLAAKAGEGYARAKQVAGNAVDKGAYELGRAIGKAKSASKKQASKKQASKKQDAAHALGKRIGKTRGMFGAFMDEYKKASK